MKGSECPNTNTSRLVKSLDTGLSGNAGITKIIKKKRKKFSPEVLTLQTDSSVTMLRMKLCSTKSHSGLKEKLKVKLDIQAKLVNIALGDGLHLPGSSSMINLATLMLPQPASKHDMNVEESYLLPLSSWGPESEQDKEDLVGNVIENNDIMCHQHEMLGENYQNYPSPLWKNRLIYNNNELISRNRKSKLARFLRFYFCPCCTCLYKMEKLTEDSV